VSRDLQQNVVHCIE